MAVKKFVVGYFEDEPELFDGVKKVRKAGYKIHDVYTPMPIHGLDKAMGLRDTSLHTAGFIYGITGTTTALSGIGWICPPLAHLLPSKSSRIWKCVSG